MLYRILHYIARLALPFYCKRIQINKPELLDATGPILIASNHPNSFLDAIILCTLFKRPIHSLARGDAFTSKTVQKIFHALNMLPIYRIRESKNNIKKNFDTFAKVDRLLAQGEIVLIFSESFSHNEWHLRPIKKGTGKIAYAALKNDIPLRVLPVGINYSNFRHLGKTIIINFGDDLPLDPSDIEHEGTWVNRFKSNLRNALSQLVFEIDAYDTRKKISVFEPEKPSKLKKTLLFIPSILGYVLHAPLYLLIHSTIKKRGGEFYDSILIGALLLLYPIYWLLLSLLFSLWLAPWLTLLIAVFIPLLALALVQYRGTVFKN